VIETGCPGIDRMLGGGLRGWSIHELAGSGATAFLVALAHRLAGPILWIAPAGHAAPVYPPGLASAGLDPDRLVMVTAPSERDRLWAAEESLRSGAAALVVIELVRPITLTRCRRLALSAGNGRATGFVLGADHAGITGEGAAPGALAPGAWTRWLASAQHGAPSGPPCWRLELVRNRAGGTGKWSIEWHEQENRFRMVCQSRHRPAGAADGQRLAG